MASVHLPSSFSTDTPMHCTKLASHLTKEQNKNHVAKKKASTLDTPKKGWNPNIHEDCESERILQGVESL